jgi:hypothetical protein
MKTKHQQLTSDQKRQLLIKAFRPASPIPKRLQRKGYMSPIPAGAKVVHRPSKWGNKYSVKEYGRQVAIEKYEVWVKEQIATGRLNISELKGYDLVCFCHTDEACHADVLIRLLAEQG